MRRVRGGEVRGEMREPQCRGEKVNSIMLEAYLVVVLWIGILSLFFGAMVNGLGAYSVVLVVRIESGLCRIWVDGNVSHVGEVRGKVRL